MYVHTSTKRLDTRHRYKRSTSSSVSDPPRPTSPADFDGGPDDPLRGACILAVTKLPDKSTKRKGHQKGRGEEQVSWRDFSVHFGLKRIFFNGLIVGTVHKEQGTLSLFRLEQVSLREIVPFIEVFDLGTNTMEKRGIVACSGTHFFHQRSTRRVRVPSMHHENNILPLLTRIVVVVVVQIIQGVPGGVTQGHPKTTGDDLPQLCLQPLSLQTKMFCLTSSSGQSGRAATNGLRTGSTRCFPCFVGRERAHRAPFA